MNARLHHLIVEAEAKLGAEAQERLAEVVETFVATWSTVAELPGGELPGGEFPGGEFTPEEMARLREIDAEPFEAVDPAEVEAVFRRRG